MPGGDDRLEQYRRYNESAKGRARRAKYETTAKSKERYARYRKSEKRREVQRRYRERNRELLRVKEMVDNSRRLYVGSLYVGRV